MADGSIRIKTKLETSNAAKGFKNLENMAKRAGRSLQNVFKGNDTAALEKSLKEQQALIKKNESAIKDEQKAMQQAQKEIDTYQTKLDSINSDKTVTALQDKLNAENETIANAKAELQNYQNELEKVQEKLVSMKSKASEDARGKYSPETLEANPKLESYEAGKMLKKSPDYQEAINQEQELFAKMRKYKSEIDNAADSAEKLKQKISDVKREQRESLTGKMTEASAKIKTSEENISSLSKASDVAKEKAVSLSERLGKLKGKADLSSSVKKSSSAFKSASKSATNFGDKVSNTVSKGIKKMIKLSLTIFSVRSAFVFAKKASSEYLQSNEQLAGQVQGIWNAAAQAVGPIVQTIIGWVVTLVSYINSFIKSLTGIDFVAQGNAAALDKQAKAAGNVAKETKKANRELASFDEMNILSKKDATDTDSGGSGGNVAQLEVRPVNIDGIKNMLEKLFEPMANAWDNYGVGFVDSFKTGLNEIWELMKSIGKSFEEVWLNGTGEETCSLILQILTNIFDTIGNIAANFRKAWDEAGIGTQIIQNIWDVVNILLGGVRDITESFKTWSSSLDFSPILGSIENLTDKLKPLAEMISESLKWAFDNVLLPFGSWTIEEGLPALIDAFAGALGFLSSVLKGMQEPVKFIWDNFLAPIAEWTGGIIVTVLEDIALAFEWLSQQEELCKFLGALAVAFGAAKLAVLAFNTVLGLSPITWIVAGITAIIVIIVECIKHWDDIKAAVGACWDWICEKWSAAVQFFADIWNDICDTFNGIKEWFQEKFQAAYDAICDVFNGIGEWFSEKFQAAWDGIKSVFSGVKNFFSNVWSSICEAFGNIAGWFKEKFSAAWQAVKNVFSAGGEIFLGIKDGILDGLKFVINALIDGINWVVKKPFDGINWALDKLRDFELPLVGGHPFGWLPSINAPQIPRLAKGGIVNNPNAGVNMGSYIAGERGPEAIVPLKDSSFIKSFAQEVASQIKTDQPATIILQIGDKEFYRWFINMKKKYDFVMNGG